MYNPQELQRKAQLNVMGVDNNAQTSLVDNAPQTKPYEFGRGLATIGDVAVNVLKGATKTLEGLFDAGAMLVGLTGADVDEIVAYDWTSDVFGEDGAEGRHNWTWGEDLTNASLLKEDSFINQVAEGVGGMLPSVALALIPGVGTALSTASFIGGAGGSASEQALNEGASYGQAFGYGAIRGGIESITERIGGRVFGKATELSDTFIGRGLQKIGADKVIGSGLGKAVYNFTSEGLEEVIADALDIPTRMITGMSNEENFNKDFKDYLGTFVTGGTVGVLLDGLQKGGSAIFNRTKGGSKYVKVAEDMKSLADNTKALALLQQNKKVSQDQLNKATKKLAERDLGLLEDMSKQFQNMTESQREEAFTTLSVDAPMIVDMFESNGKLKETINQSYNEVISQNENYNVSSNLIGNTKDIQRNLDEINEEKGWNLEISNVNYQGEERENLSKIYKAVDGLGKRSGTDLNVVVLKNSEGANAFIRNNTLYISEKNLKNDNKSGTWAEAVAHEVTHFTEKTKDFMDFGKFVLADENLKKSAIGQVLSKKQYGYTAEQIETAFNNLKTNGKLDGKDLEIYQEVVAHATEDILGNEEAINKLARENRTWTQKLLNRIKDFLSALKGTNADTKTIERLTKAEELFEKALKQAGVGSKVKDLKNAVVRANYLKDKQEYLELAEEDKAKWLEEKGYTAKDFDSDVLDNLGKTRYSYMARNPNTVTEKEFNHHYWAIANNLLSKEEIGVLNSSIGKLNSGEHFNKNADGFYMIPVGENGVLNKIVFTDGKRNSYSINQIIDINCNNETDLTDIRGFIYERERYAIQTEDSQLFEVYYSKDFRYNDFVTKIQRDTRNSSKQQNGTRSSGKTKFSYTIGNKNVEVEGEITNNLVALHNLSEDNLQRVLNLGGFPMPSIAVTTTELAHENYGDITVVFGRETIDPENDYRNVVYDRDAWTPTTPVIDIKLSNQKVDDLIEELGNKVAKYPVYKRNVFSFFDGKYKNGNGDYIINENEFTKKDISARAIQNNGIVGAYLSEKGIDIEPVYTEKGFTMGWTSYTRQEAQDLFDFVGITKDITRENATEKQREDILEKFIEYQAERKLGLYRRFSKNPNITIEEAKERIRKDFDDGSVSQLFFMAEDFFNENRPKDVFDEYSTLDKMQSKIEDKEDFYNWFWNKVQKTLEKKGIDNDSDVFDRYGNRRSFEQRHYAYTAENIVKAMSKGDQEGTGAWGMSAGVLASKLSKQFVSIEDIREAKDYLALVSEDELKEFNDKTYELYDELLTNIVGKSSDFFSDSTRRQDVGDILGKCAGAKLLTVENIKRIFNRETKGYGLDYKFNDDIAEQALLLFEMLKHIPTTYFEAKPRRVVKFNEIKQVLIPNSASQSLRNNLTKKHIPFTEYEPNENERSKIIKKLDNVRFSYTSTKDSKGNTLSKEQQEYFKDSKVRDENGNLLVVYHGSKVGGFTEFKTELEGSYFTANRKYAEEYAKGNNDNIYSVYLNITKPFDTRDAKVRRIFEKEFYGQWGNGAPLTERGLLDWTDGADMFDFIQEKGYDYDGVIIDEGGTPNGNGGIRDRGISYVAFYREQVKNTTNKNPTSNPDIRFDYLVTPSTLTEGEVAKKRVKSYANPRIYEKSEAEKVVNDIIDSIEIEGKAVSLSGKTYREVVNGLWKSLNAQDGKDKVKTAQQIANYIIEQSIVEDMLFEEENLPHYETIEMLKPYLHSFNLTGIKEEIAHTYDKDNSVYALWSAGKNKGQTADDVAMELTSMGYPINADSEWGAFQEIVNRYKEARKSLNRKRKQSLTDLYTLGQREELETQIVNAIVDKHYKNSAQLYETLRRFKNENKLMYEIAKVKDIKTFKNATVFLDPKVEAGIKIIKKLEWRGDVNSASIRNTIGELAKWYKPEENGFINENNYYNNFAEAMIDISNGEGNLTAQEVLDVANSVHLIRTILSHYSREFKNGKYVDALPSTKDKYQIMQENKGIQIGLGHKIFSGANKLVNWYFEKFCDNASIVRYMDRYNDNGFYTTIFEQLRRGTIDAEVTEMDIKKPQEEFIKSHKGFEKYVKNTTIKYENIEVPLEVAMAIYMTLKDEGSLERWAYGTNTFTDKEGKLQEIVGFAQDREVTIDEIKQQAQKTLKSLEIQFNNDVKDYIELLEFTILECKTYKQERDIKRLGVSNVKEGYYFPLINADAPAKNVDTPTMYEEIDRVSNKSFNKNRREHVKNGLYFNSATQTVNRHVKGIAQYYHLSTVIDNYNTLYNLNVSETKTPKNIKMAEKFYWENGSQFFKDLFADAQGVKTNKNNGFNKVLAFLRGSFAKFQLALNPKVWATQISSLFAATSIINPINLFKGLNKKANDIGNYCKLAELRYHDNSSALAEGVIDKVGKIGDVTMKPINLIDKKVNERLFIACQYQVEKQYNLKFGSIENKIKAGELLEKVILETQQNSLATEKSVAMRSDSEVAKSLTMFTSDAMKNTGRVIDCILKDKVLKVKLKNAKASNNTAEVNSLNKQIKANAGKGARSILALSVSAMYMALIAQFFRWLLDKEEEDEDKLKNMSVDFFGNMLGGLPIIKNLYSSVVEGYEFEGITFQVVSDLFSGVEETWDLIVKISKGDAEWDDVAKSFKTISFNAGQTLGIPTRNLYNYFVGLSKRFYPQFGYKVEGFFTDKNYNKKLSEAIKNNDTDLIETFVGIMMNDRIDGVSENVLKEFTRLMGIDSDGNGKGDYDVLPTSVGETITVNDVQYSLEEGTLKKDFKEVYYQANAEVDKLITSAKYQKLSDKAKAKAIKSLYNYYYYQAQAEVLGVEQDKKIYLFSEIVPIDQLTYAIAYAQDIKDNKKITYKKELIQKYVQSLKLSATNKKFVMAYLGYKNTDSESLFKSVINRTSLTKAQKESLIKSCGY